MMASAVENTFDSYLSLKLQELDTDEGVFGSYIKSILEGDETLEEKLEALEGILSEITQVDIGKHCREIVERWNSSQLIASCQKAAEDRQAEDDVEEKLVKLLESTQAPSSQPQRQYTDEERRIRQAILAQYSQTSDKESDDEGGGTGGGGGSVSDGVTGGGGGGKGKENCLFRNTNAAAVQQAEKEKREKAKLDSQKKKEKDKEDREKQKQLQQDKKEKRKTQKGERRR